MKLKVLVLSAFVLATALPAAAYAMDTEGSRGGSPGAGQGYEGVRDTGGVKGAPNTKYDVRDHNRAARTRGGAMGSILGSIRRGFNRARSAFGL